MTKKVLAFCLVTGLITAQEGWAQRASQTKAQEGPDRAAAYYHFSMGHLYAELAGAYENRSNYLNRAIDHYRQAMKADPDARFLAEELSDLYIQAGRLKEAVMDAESALRQNPDDVNARRILGRIYMRLIGDPQNSRINEEMVKKAIEQYSKIVEKQPKDVDTWLVLGRLHKIAQDSVESEKAFQKALDLEPENEDALTGLAMVYADLGDSRRASELLRLVVSKNPTLGTLTRLAAIYEQVRDYKQAAETLRRALDLSPQNTDLKRMLAQALLFSDQTDEALKMYEELVQQDPKDAQSFLRISQIYRQQRKFDKAREANNRAKQLEPASLEVLYNEVSLLEVEGKQAEAISALKEIVKTTEKRSYTAAEKSNRAVLIERLGLLYRSNEQHEEAVNTFRELAVLDPSLAPRVAAQVVDTYRQAKNFEKAQQEADAALKKYPEERTVRVVRASLLADLGKADEAAAEMRKLLDGKNDRETYLTMAQIYEKAKNYSEMTKAIDAAEKLSSTDEEKETVYFMRGAMYEKRKQYEESEAEFRKVLAINPENASALNYLGYTLADRNVRLNEALDLIKKALDHDPNNGAYLDSLGWVYYRLDRLEEAENYLVQALQRVPRDPTIRDHLGDVYFKQGRLKDAITQWERSLTDWQASPPAEIDQKEVAKIQKKIEGARVRLAKESAGAKQ